MDLGASEWGRRLDGLMAAVAADLQIEFQGIPEGAHHVLGSCKRHPHESAQGMLTSLRGMLGLGRRPAGRIAERGSTPVRLKESTSMQVMMTRFCFNESR